MEPSETVLLEEADQAVDRFIAENCHAGSVTQKEYIEAALTEFVHFHEEVNKKLSSPSALKFALVTSGGTVAPVEKKEIRHVTNLSTGRRGSASCEHFLRLGYKVAFLHKTGCLMPFARHFQDGSFMEHAVVDGEGGEQKVSFSNVKYLTAVRDYQKHHVIEKNILVIPFHTVADYQLAMKTTLCTYKTLLSRDSASDCSMDRLMVYLVAAVADFYIPYAQLPEEKIDSKPGKDSMTLHLHKVPKALARGLVGRLWGGGSFVTTFKLETDATRIDAKVLQHINAFSNIKLVCANLLADIRSEVKVYDVRDTENPFHVKMPPTASGQTVNEDYLEQHLVEHVASKHAEFSRGKW